MILHSSFFTLYSLLIFLLYQFHCIAGDNNFLISRNYYYLHLTVVGRNNSLLAVDGIVNFLVDLDAQELEALARILTKIGLVLTYTCCKYDGINTPHSSSVSTNVLLDAILVHAECQKCFLVALVGSLLYITHIRRNACDTEHTT